MKIPKTCPHCGAGEENFHADYLEAVHQGITIEDDRETYDYDGNYGSYDDGSTQDECVRCRNCGDEVVSFGTHVFVPAALVDEVRAFINEKEGGWQPRPRSDD